LQADFVNAKGLFFFLLTTKPSGAFGEVLAAGIASAGGIDPIH